MYEVYRNPTKVMLEANPQIEPFFLDIEPELASRAFYGTSHSPEVRGSRLRSDYSLSLIEDKESLVKEVTIAIRQNAEVSGCWESLLESWFTGHRESLKNHYVRYCHARGNCLSTMIAGGSNFPVNRAKRANTTEENRWNDICNFRKISKKAFIKSVLPFGDGSAIRSDDPNAENKLINKINILENQKQQMKDANKIIRRYFKKGEESTNEKVLLCVEELKKEVMKLFNDSEILKILELDYSGRRGFASYSITNIGANIRRLKDRCSELKSVQQSSINDEFENGVIVSISDDHKIVIEFGFKPDEDTREKLKGSAFKWSRYRTAWVRKLTANAESAYYGKVKPMLADLAA